MNDLNWLPVAFIYDAISIQVYVTRRFAPGNFFGSGEGGLMSSSAGLCENRGGCFLRDLVAAWGRFQGCDMVFGRFGSRRVWGNVANSQLNNAPNASLLEVLGGLESNPISDYPPAGNAARNLLRMQVF